MQFRIVDFFKNGCSWNPWAGGTLLVPQFVIPCLLHKNDQHKRYLFTANNLNKTCYDVKKHWTWDRRQTILWPLYIVTADLKLLHRVMGKRFEISLWSPGLWSLKSRHPTPTPGNFDYPTPTPTPTPTFSCISYLKW